MLDTTTETTMTTDAAPKYYEIRNSYEVREQIKRAGGLWRPASKMWTLTQEQYDDLCAQVAESGRRSNKRDRALYTAWQRVTVTERIGSGTQAGLDDVD